MNTFGTKLRLTTFGESHGPAVGGVLDGVPSCIPVDMEYIKRCLDRRRTGGSPLVSARKEADMPEFLSGLTTDGRLTLGTPIAFIVRNSDCRSSDYDQLEHLYRPNHADYTYDARYGIRDWRGGGRASARETVCRVVAGAFASMILRGYGVSIEAGVIKVGETPELPFVETMAATGDFIFPESLPDNMREEIERARMEGDSVGATVGCVVRGLRAGIGNPVYGKLHALLAEAMLSVNAAKGFDYGYGFHSASARGTAIADSFSSDAFPSDYCDCQWPFAPQVAGLGTLTNFSGGVQGGISNGMPVYFRVAFKPTPSVSSPLDSADSNGRPVKVSTKGRHDPCVGIRAVPVVEAMAALVVADLLLQQTGYDYLF